MRGTDRQLFSWKRLLAFLAERDAQISQLLERIVILAAGLVHNPGA